MALPTCAGTPTTAFPARTSSAPVFKPYALELTLDIMNVANLLNKDWGRTFSSGYNSEIISPITYKGDGVFQFANSSDMPLKYPSSYYSRWRGQVGLKYTF